jgi:aromatic-L-amino-acid decarboxylase
MTTDEFRRHGYAVIDRIAEYLREPDRWPVLPAAEPGSIRAALPDASFDGTINDTASVSTLQALAAAREWRAALQIRELGLAGRPELPRLRVYCSEEAHSSVDKAALTLGLGLAGVRRVATDDRLALDPVALETAVAEDRAAGVLPLAVVATVGTTATTAIAPVPAIASICDREGLWLHVDAAYAGAPL